MHDESTTQAPPPPDLERAEDFLGRTVNRLQMSQYQCATLAYLLKRLGPWPRLKPYHARFRCLDCNARVRDSRDDEHHDGCVGHEIAEMLRLIEGQDQ